MSRKPKVSLMVRFLDTGRTVSVSGRDAWTLRNLIEAGAAGVRPIDRPAPRWSEYVRRLRARGFDIETVRELHGGDFAGHHGVYKLQSRLTIVQSDDGESAAVGAAAPTVPGRAHSASEWI